MSNVDSQAASQPRIAILGAGLVGRLLAFRLRETHQVTLYDKDDADGTESAAYLAAAMLAPLAESADAPESVMILGQMALERWPGILEQLSTPVFFQKSGSLILAFDQDRGNLQQFKARLKGGDYQEVDAQAIAELEPEINGKLRAGLYLPNEGQLDNRALLAALAKDLQTSSNIDWQQNTPVEVNAGNYYVNGQLLTDFDWIIDCRGFGAKQELNEIAAEQRCTQSESSTFRGVRGEVVRIRAPEATLNRPVRLMHPRYPIYISPKEDGVFVIGATQLESEDQRQPTVRSALELLSACFSIHSGFAEAEIEQIAAGLRPAFLDNEPKIYINNNQLLVNGLFRHGYLLAPVVVEQCIQILNGEQKTEFTDVMPSLVESIAS